eukprot:TRINITY_DN32818_c0_g1_i1.p1 TRINITY_DN32818_c0_g1~~TRINITY_DN32818_c0_g1_i1.p1  ORF type:complete len:532 (-),score=153.78 TRINITY_DN32818_c0_g1_i1:683-2278(-)
MNSARLREYYSQTQLLLSELQALGSESYGNERANAKHQQLARLAVLLRHGAEALTDKEARAIWEERASKLHNDLVAVTAVRLQREDQSVELFWAGCVHLLYAGVAIQLQQDAEVAALQEEMKAQQAEYAKLQAALQSLQEQREAAAKENLELRMRAVVQQQDIQRREADTRDHHAEWQTAVRERDALLGERQKLVAEVSKTAQELERQAKVIGQLMERSEVSLKERNAAVETLKQVDEEHHILQVNLHQHTLVVEKLIGLNTELMESANYNMKLKEDLKREVEQLRKENNVKGGPAEAFSPAPGPGPEREQGGKDEAVPVSISPQGHEEAFTRTSPRRDAAAPAGPAAGARGFAGLRGAWLGGGGGKVHPMRELEKAEEIRVEEDENGAAGRAADLPADEEEGRRGKAGDRRAAQDPLAREAGGDEPPTTPPTGTRPIQPKKVWTSDMLPLAFQPAPVENGRNGASSCEESHGGLSGSFHPGEGLDEEEEGGGVVPAALLKEMGGRARGFLSYIAGADKTDTGNANGGGDR